MAEQRIGQYRIVRQLGVGGMGTVYEAIREGLEKRAAIKVLHADYSKNEQFRARFFNEARAVNMAVHPGIVNVFEVGVSDDGSAFLVMEYLEGETLRTRLGKQGRAMTVGESVRLIRQIASALAVAHSKNIIHRDLKPDNIMIVPDSDVQGGERTKVLDFGIAKIAEASQPGGGGVHTRTGMMLGTPAYMAPEQCRGSGKVDTKADVYSLGIIFYQMLAGQVPFTGEGAGELIAHHLIDPPPPLASRAPNVPPLLADLVHRMLAKKPTERPTMLQVQEALDAPAMLATLPLSGMLPTIKSSDIIVGANNTTMAEASAQRTLVPSAGWRGPWLRVAALIVLMVCVLGATWIARGGGPAAWLTGGDSTHGKRVRLRLTSEPSGAVVVRNSDGMTLGRTPWQFEAASADGNFDLVLKRAGYVEQRVSLSRKQDSSQHVTLKSADNSSATSSASSPGSSSPSPPPSVSASTDGQAGASKPKPAKVDRIKPKRLKSNAEIAEFK